MASLTDKIASNAKKQGLKKKAKDYTTIKEPQQDPAVNRLRELAQAQKSKLANRSVKTTRQQVTPSSSSRINKSAFADLTRAVTLSNADRGAKTPYIQKNKNTIADVIDQSKKTARVREGLAKANSKQPSSKSDTGEWAKAESWGALTGLNSELASTVDFFLPDVITPEPIQRGLNYYRNENKKQQEKIQRLRGDSRLREFVGTVGQNTIQQIPTAIMAYLSGGTSLATKAPSLLNPSSLSQTGSVISRAMNQVAKDTGKNPMFWETFARTVGTTYDNEIESGASPVKATLSAFTNALLNAQIEIGGGIEAYDPTEKFLHALLRGAKEEGLEEVQQYAVENLTNKAIGSNTSKWFSMDKDTNAVINPKAMAEQGMYGAVAGGLLTGGRNRAVNAVNKISDISTSALEGRKTASIQKALVSLGVPKEESASVTESVQRIFKGTATIEDKQKVSAYPEAMRIFEESEGVRADADLSYSKLTEINDSIAKAQNRGYRNFEGASTGSHIDYNPTRRTITGSNRVNSDLMETMAPQRQETRLTPTRGASQNDFTFQIGNSATGESVAPQQAQTNLNIQTVERLSQDFPQGTRTQFVEAYDGQTDPVQYFEEMNNLRMEGRRGEELVVSETTLSPQQQQIAYNAGVQEAQNEVHLRNSNEWNDSTNPTGQVQGMEEGAGETESDRGLYEDRSQTVSTGESRLGREIDHSRINFEFSNKIYEPTETTEEMEVVRRAGEEKGYKVNYFVGDYARRIEGSGTALERAWVDFDNKEIWIRSDDPSVTVKQIFGHEIFHTELANKEYKQALLENVRNRVGDKAWNALLQAYASAYAGTSMSIEELQEELLCDINGNLNGFKGLFGTERLTKLFERVGQEVRKEIDKTPKSNKAPPGEGRKYSSTLKRINETLTDEERYDILKDKKLIVLDAKIGSLNLTELEVESLRRKNVKEAQAEAVRLAKALGITGEYQNKDIDFTFEYTNNGIDESSHKQRVVNSEDKFVNFIGLLTNLKGVIQNAHLIEKHTDEQYTKKHPEHKQNRNLKYTYVLVSAFSNDDYYIPVKLTVMEYKNGVSPKLHVALTTTEIEKSRIMAVHGNKSDVIATSTSNVMLADILSNVKDETLKQYIPEQFFNRKASTVLDSDNEELNDFLKENNLKKLPQVKYSNVISKDSLGNELTKRQKEFFKDSQARDANGNLAVVYHTTDEGGFTVFNPKKSDDKRSLFFASNFDVSQTYSYEGGYGAREHIFTDYDFSNYASVAEWFGKIFGNGTVDREFHVYKSGTSDPAVELGRFSSFRRLQNLMKGLDEGTINEDEYEIQVNVPSFRRRWTPSELREVLRGLPNDTPQSGYYACYLNLKNPLIVDGRGSSWRRIPYGKNEKKNPIRDKTLKKMEEDASFIIDSIHMEWGEWDDNFQNGNYRDLSLLISGKKRSSDGSFEDWSVDKEFYVNEDDLAESEEEEAGAILQYMLYDYWQELGLSDEYYEEVVNYADDVNGDVEYTPAMQTQERASDYITSDGYKLDYAEIFEELNDEAGTDYAPYEGLNYGSFSTRELAKIAEKEGYDGVIIRNIVDLGGKSYMESSASKFSDIYVAFKSEQVKLTSNENPTSKKDIRYSTAIRQFDVIQKSNPMLDSYHSGVRSVDDIKSAQQVFSKEEFSGTPDWTYADARKALKNGKVTVFSSKDIIDGAFVTPSMMEAINYAGGGSFYQREVSIDNVAWIDSVEGQYAPINGEDPESTVRFSTVLHRTPFPKPVIQEGGEVVGENVYRDKGMPMLATTMEINAETMKMMGKESQIPVVKGFLDRMANFMDQMALKYTFIGLNDVNNATLEMRYDKDGNPVSIVVSAMVKNGEYPVNFDFSSICKKRQALSKMFQELGSDKRGGLIDKVELSQENLWEINKILSRNGFETACLGCFVETKRYNIEEWADSFVEKWNKAVKAVNPNAGYFNYGTRKDISYGYVGDEIDKFAENKRAEVERESRRRIKERDDWKRKYLKDNPSKTDSDAEKAFREWWQNKYNKKAKDYKESWFTKPALSNESAIASLVNSGEKMQKLLKKSDIISPTGLKALMGLHKDFYGVLYGHYGSGTPKPMVAFTPYNSEIALLDRRKSSNGGLQKYTKASNDKMIQKLVAIGGVRVQSFSDFLIQNVFDYMQMVADMSARDFPAHAYTKEIAFARIFGLTGMKINLSVMFDVDPDGIAPGLDKDGNYVVADKARQDREKAKGREVFTFSISFEEARELQKQAGYDGKLGIIGVGLSDLHIRKMLNDNDIKMVIPYHASGMPAVIKQVTGLESATNYESTQNTLEITKVEDSNGEDVTEQYGKDYFRRIYAQEGSWRSAFAKFRSDIEEKGLKVTTKKKFGSIGDFPLYTGDSTMSLDVTNDPKLTAEYYMGWCVDQGAIPLFYQFADEENYYKVLYDFNVYKSDGTYAPQQAVTNTYPEELEKIIDGYMEEANDFEIAQNARWEDTVKETEKMLRKNSFKASTVMPAVAELRRENEQLKEKVDYYKSQTKRTKRASLRTNDIKALVKDLKSSYSSLAESDDLTKKLKALGEELVNGHGEMGEVDFDRVKAGAVDIAQDIVFGASELVNDPTRQQYKDLVAWFKGKTIQVVNPSDFPDYNDFRKSVMGKMKLSKSSGHTMGSYWEALQQRFGKQMFPDAVKASDGSESVNDSDLITYVLEMMDFAEDTYENPFSFDLAGAVENCANELIDRLLDESVRQNPPTYADRKERQIEKLKIRNAQKVQDAIKRERKKRDDKIKAFKDHQKEMREKRATRRAESDARTKLLNVARRLDKIKTTEANRALINSLIGELDLVAKSMTNGTELKLNELRDWYKKQLELDPYFKDTNVENKIERLEKKQISDMDINDVRDLTDVLRAIENSIRTADRFIDSYYKHSIHQAGLKVIDDVNNAKGVSDNFFGKIDRFFISGTLSPERQIRRVVGYVDNDPLYIATKELSAGQRKMLAYQKSSWDMFKDLMDDKNFIKSLNGKKAREIEIKCVKDGKVSSIKVTPDVAISLYLSSMNDDNMRHMENGGVNIPDLKLYKAGKVKEAFRKSTRVKFSKEYLTAIKGMLTPQEVKFANKAYWYYNMVAPKAINEVSEILKGYSLAREPNYFPIYTDSNFLEKDFESLKFDGTIEGMGSLKERAKASNPIMINGIVDTLTRSIQENSLYVGLAMPVRNMNKLLGVKDITRENVEKDGVAEVKLTYNGSVSESIHNVWGEQTMRYIEKFMTDLQRNKSSDYDDWENLLNSLRSNYAGAVLTLNASVAIKQAASYPTAMAVLGAKPLVRAMGNIGKVDLDLIAKYTPLQWYRSQGFSNKELGDIKSTRRDSVVDRITSVKLFNWIQGMDLLTTRKLWKASEYYIREQNKDLKVGTDEYYKAVADIYNRVIEETQPNYTTMQRPGLLRSDKSLVQMLNMFKTQPYQNFNILYDSIGNYVAKRTQYMSSKSEEAKKAFKQAGKDMRNSVSSQVIQLAVFAMMTSLWALFRGKDDKYRDKEGKITIESYMKQLGKDMVSGASAMVPLGSEIYGAGASAFTGDYYYGFSSVTNATIADLFDSMNKSLTLIPDIAGTVTSGEDISDKQKKEIKSLIESVSRVSGIPTINALNLWYAGARWASIAGEGEYVGEYEALKMTFAKDVDKKAVLWDAYKNDQKEYEKLRKIMIDDGMKEDSLDTYIKDKMKENPSEEQSKTYDSYVNYLEGKSTWENFPEDKKEDVLKILNKIAVGIEDNQTEGYTKRDMSPEKIALIKSALYEADMSYGNKSGTYDKDDKKKAVELLKGMLTESEKQKVLNW